MQLYNEFIRQITVYQYELNRYIASTIRSIDDQSSITIYLTVLGIAFLYGVIHAAGPGHGKALVAFYFTSNKQNNYKKAFKMGYLISIFHAISALILTFTIYFIIKTMFRQNFQEFTQYSLHLSAILIIIVALYLLFDAYKHKNEKEESIKETNKSDLSVAFSAGVVPCPGVMTIVLFCIMLKQYLLGVLAALTMSIGMGLTISLAGIASIAINKKAGIFLEDKAFILQFIGALLILALGVLLLFGSLKF